MLVPLLSPDGPSAGGSLVMAVRDDEVSIRPVEGDLPGSAWPAGPIFVGVLDGRHCWAVDYADEGQEPDGAGFSDLRALYGLVDESTWVAAGRAVQLVEWSRNHRFCGRCATATEPSGSERSMRCPRCRLAAFPRLAPAVIVLVERDDGHALLARNAQWPTPMYSCVAGFVEPGETVEEAVRREVMEEVGVRLGGLGYFGSQPWPFPHSLMLGFHASYAGGELCCDGDEIADAGWFRPDALPQLPGSMSIARRLIEDWRARTSGGARTAPAHRPGGEGRRQLR